MNPETDSHILLSHCQRDRTCQSFTKTLIVGQVVLRQLVRILYSIVYYLLCLNGVGLGEAKYAIDLGSRLERHKKLNLRGKIDIISSLK